MTAEEKLRQLDKVTVYTLGYDKRDPAELLWMDASGTPMGILPEHNIGHLIDVRAWPWRSQKGWSQKELREKLGSARYIWAKCWGNTLRLPPEEWWPLDPGLHNALMPVVQAGLLGDVLLLCLESNHERCHRSAIARNLGCKTVHL